MISKIHSESANQSDEIPNFGKSYSPLYFPAESRGLRGFMIELLVIF